MEADFRDHGVAAFGAEVNDQALFTVWTLRKINDLASRICATDAVKPHLVPADREQAMRFVMHVLHGRFHLDCLKSSLRTGTPIYPEVLGCISEGLRSVVNGYSHIKQACDLRNTEENEEMIFIDFDEEERELLASSMADAFQ
jgi:hypothetical protein